MGEFCTNHRLITVGFPKEGPGLSGHLQHLTKSQHSLRSQVLDLFFKSLEHQFPNPSCWAESPVRFAETQVPGTPWRSSG